MEKLAINVTELAKVLGIGQPNAYDLVNRSDFPAIRIGRRILIPMDKLREWLDNEAGRNSY